MSGMNYLSVKFQNWLKVSLALGSTVTGITTNIYSDGRAEAAYT